MATQVNLGIGVVDNTQSGLSSAERNISRFSKKSIKQLELEAKVSFPSISGQIDGLEKNFSALKRKLGKFQFSGMRVGKKGNILGDMLFDAREIRGNLSTDVTKGLLDNLKAIQKGLSTGSVKSNNILGIDTAKEIKKINELIAALETYNKQMKVIERAWGAQDTAKIQAEKRKAYSAEFEEARKQKKDDELFRRRWAHEFGQWNKKDAELARLQREADQRAKDARIQYDRKINSGTDTRTPELNDLRKFYQEQEKLANKAAKAEAEATKEVERQFKSRVKAKRNAADIEVAIDNERAARDKASKTHSDRTVENIKKEIASLKELRKAENALDRAQGKKSRNARHDSDTNQRIKLLEQEAEAAKKSADERKKADKDATDAARRNAKSRREWIKKEQALMKKLGGAILRAFSIHQIIRFGEQIAKTTGYYEQQQIALEGILKSATKARSVLNDITNFALKSPFTTKELVGFTKKLSAFGIGSDDLFPTVTKLADISAGLGVDMSRIILAYGQVKSASVLRGQELRQFTEAGIPMVEALAEKFTELNGELVTTSDIFELISERKVSFEMVSDVLSDMTAEGGSFYKMQEELTNTLAGQMSKLRDMWDLALKDMGKSGSGVLNGVVKLLQRMVKDALSFSVAIATAFATPMLAKAIVHFKALSRLLRISLQSIKGIGAGIYGLAAGALALAITKVIRSTTELKRAFEDIETSFRKETDKMIGGLDSLAKKISKAKVGTKEFADAVDTLSSNYGDFVSDDIINKLKAQDEISENLAKNFGETANNIREAIIELKKFQELEEKKETVVDMFLQEKTQGKTFRNWMRNNGLGTSDMTKDVFKSMYGRDARNNRELLDIWDELYDDAVTMFANGEDLSKEEFERIFSDMIKDTFPEISEEELLRVVSLGWQTTSRNTGAGINNLYDDLVDSQNRITNSDYYKLQKTFEDWTKEYKDSEDFVEKQNNMETAYFKALRDSVVGKFGENDLTRALESAYGMQDGKVIATNFDNQSVNNILKVIEEFESTITDEKAKTWFSEAKKLFQEGVEDKSDRAAIVSDRMEAHAYLTDEIVSGLWRQYIPNNQTYKAFREQIKSDYNEAKTELESYTGNDPKDQKRKNELSKRIEALETLASVAFYDVDLTEDKKGGGNKYERIRITNFFDDLLSLVTKAEDEMKKITGVTGYTNELGNFVDSLSADNFLKAFFTEGGNPFEKILAKMTEYGITDFLPNFDQTTLKNIFRDAGWEEGKPLSIPDFKAIYERVIRVVGDQVLEGLKARRDSYAVGSSERNSLDSAIKSLQEQQSKSINEMETRWGADEIGNKIESAVKELASINGNLDKIKNERELYSRITNAGVYTDARKSIGWNNKSFSSQIASSIAMMLKGAGSGLANTNAGAKLSTLVNSGKLGIGSLSALLDIAKELEDQAAAIDPKTAGQFKDVVKTIVDSVKNLVESIVKDYEEWNKYITVDKSISNHILNSTDRKDNASNILSSAVSNGDITDAEKVVMILKLLQDEYNSLLSKFGGSELPKWVTRLYADENSPTGISKAGMRMANIFGDTDLTNMVIRALDQKYRAGGFGEVGSEAAIDNFTKAVLDAVESLSKMNDIVDKVDRAVQHSVDAAKSALSAIDATTSRLGLRKGSNGKLYDKDGNLNLGEKYYQLENRKNTAGQVVDLIGNFAGNASGVFKSIMSGDIFGAISSGIKLISDLISNIIGIGDSSIQAKQDELIRSNDKLANAMNSLDHSLKTAAGNEKYDIYFEKASNLRQQQALYEELLYLENLKKEGDADKAADYAKQAEEAGKALEDLQNDFKSEILSTADEIANTLTDALVGAFREGTNAARSWRDAVKEYIGDVLKQELMTKIISPRIDDIMSSFFGSEQLTSDQVKELFSDEGKVLDFVDALNTEGTNLVDIFNALPQELKDLIAFNSSTSALSGGISGITEDTARTLEGLANSMLMQMILTNRELSTISQSGFAQVQVSWFNDMLQQARATRTASEQIKQILDETRSGIRPLKVEVM